MVTFSFKRGVMEIFGVIVVGLLVIGGIAAIGYYLNQKRLEALELKATELGLTMRRGKDHNLDNAYYQFDLFREGRNRYAANLITGSYDGHPVIAFDYHYQTESRDSKGNKQTHHHRFHCFVMNLPISCPEVRLRPEGWFDKLAGAVGFDDIDFESYEFSKAFHVKSEDKRFAYDLFHPRMMELFLAAGEPVFEADGTAMMISQRGKMKPERLEAGLNLLTAIRDQFPDHLLKGSV